MFSSLDCLIFACLCGSAALGKSVCSALFFRRSALWNRDYWCFAFIKVFSHVQGAIAGSIFCNIWISIITRTYYVPVKFQVSRSHSAWARWIAIPLLVPPQSIEQVLKKVWIWMQVVPVCLCISFGSLLHLLQRDQSSNASFNLSLRNPVMTTLLSTMMVGKLGSLPRLMISSRIFS